MPNLERLALQSRYKDNSLRLVYPVGGMTIEKAADTASSIVTLSTPDGFQMSFELTQGQLHMLADTAEDGSTVGSTLQLKDAKAVPHSTPMITLSALMSA